MKTPEGKQVLSVTGSFDHLDEYSQTGVSSLYMEAARSRYWSYADVGDLSVCHGQAIPEECCQWRL